MIASATGGRREGARPDPPLLGQRLLERGEALFLHLDRLVHLALPEELNPVAQAGAVANTALLVATATGVLLLLWYSPSVHLAYSSVAAMQAAPFSAQLVRSLHRYSSDGCMLFVLLHALRLALARRFAGARWLAWVTGVALVGLLWLVGWLGYWLVWDERARQVALGTARLVDALPIFVEPLARSFLVDGSVNSLLFFVIFFFHMLIPLAMGVALWLHLTRLNRARFLTRWPLTLAVLGSLVLLSLLVPATSAAPARMLVDPGRLTVDAWYLLPLWLTDRLGGGALWALVLVSGVALGSAPWWVARGRAPVAQVELAKCNGCTLCHQDCPYNAITMVPRTDGRGYALQAQVDPSRCVGCGICAGSCDPSGIGLGWLPSLAARSQIDRWLDEHEASSPAQHLAFVCSNTAADLKLDAETGRCDLLPGYRAMAVSCIGWVHMLTVERALRHGAPGVLLVGCGPGACSYREGERWTELRQSGARAPALRLDKVDPARVRLLSVDRTQPGRLAREAARFRAGEAARPGRAGRAAPLAAGAGLALALGAATAALAQLPYRGPPAHGAEVVVSLKHPGRVGEHCRQVSEEEKQKLPPHMRRDQICERGRAPVRLKVAVDSAVRLERAYPASGLSGDGTSVAVERLALEPGSHLIQVSIGETSDPGEWSFHDERRLTFEAGERRVLLFDRVSGFAWHGANP